jgi:capsular polysaccharide transport system permease protein
MTCPEGAFAIVSSAASSKPSSGTPSEPAAGPESGPDTTPKPAGPRGSARGAGGAGQGVGKGAGQGARQGRGQGGGQGGGQGRGQAIAQGANAPQNQTRNQKQIQAQKQAEQKARNQALKKADNQAQKQAVQAEKAAPPPVPPVLPVPPPAPAARARTRHWIVLFSFLLMVAAPVSLTGWYLWTRAADQYASNVGFSVRKEEVGSAIELLGGITEISGSSSSDTDILYEFLQSQELVAAVDADLDLRRIWARGNPDTDPVFAYHPPGTIEDLQAYWARMVRIYYDSGTGLLDLRVLAFDPQDAHAVATRIYARSSAMINQLSAVAREDAIGYAREELTQAEDRLREARVAIQAFRNRTQIIDPTIQTQTQSGLIGALESQLAEAQIELQLLRATARDSDPRITQTELKIEVIERQIASERAELGLENDASGGSSVADLVGEYEALAVDLEFAQQAYTAARATFDAARNEARRQSRYLAAHVSPTRAERAQYPDRVMILGLIALFLTLFWAVTVLVAYALRDRR